MTSTDFHRRPRAADETSASVAETHSATIFFTGNKAYKLKKPVNLGFLDFSTREAREVACRRETALNRRFTADVYLGVAEVRDPSGQVCDHLVVMRRMPAIRRLSTLIRAGASVDDPIRAVARILAAQHSASERRPEIDHEGSRDAIWGRWRDSIAQLRGLDDDLVEESVLADVEGLSDRFLTARQPLFEARIREGRVVDGHGDLLANDIFCLEDGPRILDCIEFDDRLRWLDGLDDASFLAMDLERLGAPGLAERFSRWYVEFSADPAPTSLRHHYVAYRAFVRAKVGWIRAAQGDLGAADEARSLADLALKHLRAGAATLVLIGGLPGTGKSTLSGAVADWLGFAALNTDQIRKELAGIAPDRKAAADYSSGIYTREWTDRTYAEMISRAAILLRNGESVILDASWTSADHRTGAIATANATASDLVQLRCVAPDEIAEQRLRNRRADVSDADPVVAAHMAAEQDPWPDAVTIDMSGPAEYGTEDSQAGPGSSLRVALNAIRPHGPEHVWRPQPQ